MMKIILILVFVLVVGVIAWALLQHKDPPPGRKWQAQMEVKTLHEACKNYLMAYAHFPTGEASQVYAALSGNNPRDVRFVYKPDYKWGTNGIVLDPWNTPYQIDFIDSETVIVRSAGKDVTWKTPDDIEGR